VLAEIHFKMQVDAGRRELDAGLGISHQEIKERMAKWLSRQDTDNPPKTLAV